MDETALTRRSPEARAFRSERVIEVATELAAEGGYDAVQMREVARRAPVALATLYRYYPSKDVLLKAAIGAQLDALALDMERRPSRKRTPATRAAEVFIRAFHAMVRNRGFAHAAMTAFQAPKPIRELPEGAATAGPRTHQFMGIAAAAAWGPDHRPTAEQRTALSVLESLWVSSVVDWLNDQVTATYVEARLRFAAERLLFEE